MFKLLLIAAAIFMSQVSASESKLEISDSEAQRIFGALQRFGAEISCDGQICNLKVTNLQCIARGTGDPATCALNSETTSEARAIARKDIEARYLYRSLASVSSFKKERISGGSSILIRAKEVSCVLDSRLAEFSLCSVLF